MHSLILDWVHYMHTVDTYWVIVRHHIQGINVTGSAKRGLIADPNCTYLEPCNLPCKYGTTLKLGCTLKLGPTVTLA